MLNLINSINYKDVDYIVDLTYDNVLIVFDVTEDEILSESEKVEVMHTLFFGKIEIDFEYKCEMVKIVFEYLNDDKKEKESKSKKKIMCFKEDAERICASFLQFYNLDLVKEKGKLHYKKFIALLNNLDEKSEFKKAIGYRQLKLPKRTKDNKDEYDRLKKLKEYYALESNKEIERQERLKRENEILDSI